MKIYKTQITHMPQVYPENKLFPLGEFDCYLTEKEINLLKSSALCRFSILDVIETESIENKGVKMEQKTTKNQTIKWIIIAVVVGLLIVGIRIAIGALTKGK